MHRNNVYICMYNTIMYMETNKCMHVMGQTGWKQSRMYRAKLTVSFAILRIEYAYYMLGNCELTWSGKM